MIDFHLNTKLDGCVAVTDTLHQNKELQADKSLYKFIWVKSGSLSMEVDHIPLTIQKNEVVTLTPYHHIDKIEVNGEYLSLLFNSNFYCIFGHDDEVSCSGFLFNGSSNLMHLELTDAEAQNLSDITRLFLGEWDIHDNLQEEMLRILLKRFIIACTRIARRKFGIGNDEQEKNFDIVRKYYNLVDKHFKEKKQVQDYADMLFRSPKTLSNLFAVYGQPSPLHIIHDRIEAEAKRLFLYTNKSAKEISNILGFEDLATFSRFFKKKTGKSISDYRKGEKRE